MTHTLASQLAASFPSLSAYRGKIVLVKYGGAAMENETTRHTVCQEVAALFNLGIKVVVVHGGGKEISRMMERVGLKPHFIDGLRVTDADAMVVTEMVLSGTISSDLASRITRSGTPAMGLSGRDARLLLAKPLKGRNGEDLGQTGEVDSVNPLPIHAALNANLVPVVSPVGEDSLGRPLNLNADYAAAAIAGSLSATPCIFLTDVPGVKVAGSVAPELSHQRIKELIHDGTISGGMIPKVECALRALEAGCGRAIICEASQPSVISSALTGVGFGGTTIS
jgi:acetylglutamate kinase